MTENVTTAIPKNTFSVTNSSAALTARKIDFVTKFEKNWNALREIMGIMRPIKRENGSTLYTKTATVTLESGAVGEGEVIPFSKATVTETPIGSVKIEKFARATSVEAVDKYGPEAAIQMTDDEFRNELTGKILDSFYTYLTGNAGLTNSSAYGSLQMAIAMAIGRVKDSFKKMRRDSTNIVVFVNTLDAYEYLGAAELTVQTAFGIDYIQNFLGAQTVILSSEIEPGAVFATPAENIVMYYVDPSNSGYAQLGLDYAVSGETNLIGFSVKGNYERAIGETFALMGVSMFAEYTNGIAKMTFSTASNVAAG